MNNKVMLSWFERNIRCARLARPRLRRRLFKKGNTAEGSFNWILHRRAGMSCWCALFALGVSGPVRSQSTAPVIPTPPTKASSLLDRSLSALQHTSFTGPDGAPVGVTAFAQTSDGFLWVGTHYGLYLFDGARFQIQADGQLQSSHIHSLWADKNGDVWIGFSTGGVSVIRNGSVKNYLGGGLPSGTAFDIARTPDGSLWVATTQGLGRLLKGNWQTVGATWGVQGVHPQGMHLAADGILWVFDDKHAYRLMPKSPRFEVLDVAAYSERGLGLPTSVPQPQALGITDTMIDSSGAIWQTGKDGLTRYRWSDSLSKNGPPSPETMRPDVKLSGVFIFTMFEDAGGDIWLGTNGGLDRFRRTRLNVMRFPQAIYQPAMVAGDQGDIWVGTTRSAGYHVVSNVIEQASVIPPMTSMMTREPDGTIWLAAPPGLMRLNDGHTINVGLPVDIPRTGYFVQALARQGDESLWLSMVGHGLHRFKDGIWSKNGGFDQLPMDQNPQSLVTAADGSLWMGYPRNRLFVVSGKNIKHFDEGERISVGNVQAISVRGGDAWIGGERGVEHLTDRHFVPLVGEGGETFKDISGIVQTEQGDLWLNGAFGLYRITAGELELLKGQPARTVAFDHFTSIDGLDGPADQIRPTPTLIEGSDGRIWASTENGVVWVDPKKITAAKVGLFPVIQTIEANGVSHLPSEETILPKGTKSLRIDYTAPILSEPERVRFRYRLLGFDKNWQEAEAHRDAYFTNLTPKQYTFQVEAKLDGESWSSRIGQSTFRISPSFYQTWWFNVLSALTVALILWWVHLLRMRRLTTRMRIRRHERECVARDLHDTLLQSVQGLILQVHIASEYDADPLVRHRILGDAVASAQIVLKEGRDKVMDLRDHGDGSLELAEWIRQFALGAPVSFDGTFRVVLQGGPKPLRVNAKDDIFSVVREMIINVWNHAGATSIDVFLNYGWRFLRICVSDNGCGIPMAFSSGGVPSGRWGVLGMRERARQLGGSLIISQSPSGGTVVELRVPARRAYIPFGSHKPVTLPVDTGTTEVLLRSNSTRRQK